MNDNRMNTVDGVAGSTGAAHPGKPSPDAACPDATYPGEPWHLRGQAYLSAWRLPRDLLPEVPAGVRPLVIGHTGFVITAWVDYQAGGELAYRELMCTVAVRHGAGIAASITHIWVDSPASLAGGRALWHIPKELAEFELEPNGKAATARAEDGGIAGAAFRVLPGLPVRWRFGFSVLQAADVPGAGTRSADSGATGAPKRSPVLASARVVPARAAWHIVADGPLHFLRGYAPFAGFAVRDFRMRFGSAPS